MKLTSITTILTTLLFCIPMSNATAADAPINVTTRVTIVAMSNSAALQFSAKQDLSGKPANALAALERLVEQKQAVSVANLALTAGNGINGMTSSGKINLNCTAMASPDGKTANITVVLNNNGHELMSSVALSNGAVIFLGSMQSAADETMTEYVFARVSY